MDYDGVVAALLDDEAEDEAETFWRELRAGARTPSPQVPVRAGYSHPSLPMRCGILRNRTRPRSNPPKEVL